MKKLNTKQYNDVADFARNLNCENELISEVREYVEKCKNVRKLIDEVFCGQVEQLASFIEQNSIVERSVVGSVYVKCHMNVYLQLPDKILDNDINEFVQKNLEDWEATALPEIEHFSCWVESNFRMLPYEKVQI